MIMQLENFPKFPPNLSAYVRAGVSEKLPQNTGRETPPNWSQAGTPAMGQSPGPQRNNSGDGQRPAAPGAVPPGRTVRGFLIVRGIVYRWEVWTSLIFMGF